MQLPQNEVWRGIRRPGTIWGYHTSTFFLKIFANMYRERKTWSSRKFGESCFFLAKMMFSRWKNLEQPSYVRCRGLIQYQSGTTLKMKKPTNTAKPCKTLMKPNSQYFFVCFPPKKISPHTSTSPFLSFLFPPKHYKNLPPIFFSLTSCLL